MLNRRTFLASSAATAGLAACGDQAISFDGTQRIEGRVDATRNYMLNNVPMTQPLLSSAKAVLYMPLLTEAGFGVGGAYGEGALRIGDNTVAYYSAAKASIGLQAGAQQYAHALFFNTDAALNDFRSRPVWSASADAFYALPATGMEIGRDTLTMQYPIIAVIFGQSGLMAGAAIEGTKYTRIAGIGAAGATSVIPGLNRG
ncbi:MAG: YSC84-related protein [Paracoccus sp. (in: a-proteobacteria)]|uniref:lipid-binding SYLF domain-containing protein n=1 Tax=Paracoccus sp. TaxID=267 RepID=UPI0026E0B838|nr:YSC84-related protein [Paracoccus sp. (in: a-proteobacteria)]MDO5621614.1 YSC84-related protein [Paracoccus sp. (in: a-proteobacteria)]